MIQSTEGRSEKHCCYKRAKTEVALFGAIQKMKQKVMSLASAIHVTLRYVLIAAKTKCKYFLQNLNTSVHYALVS